MAEESDQQRSHAPTPRRLEQAREEGRVARSRELTGALLMLAAAGTCFAGGRAAGDWMGELLRVGLTFGHEAAFDTGAALALAGGLVMKAFLFLVPILVLAALIALLAPMAMGGWLFTSQPITPDLDRLSPGRWLSQLLSAHGAIEVAKSVAKALLICGAAALALWHQREELGLLLAGHGADAIGRAAQLAGTGLVAGAFAMLLIAAADVPAQLWRHQSSLRMTAQEVRREMKESEGDPQLKQKIRSQQREVARRRMMTEVAKADVVVTNPAHYAVALAWDAASNRAPRVVAKGMDLVAARIKELAAEHSVPVLEAPPLARALHRHAELGDEIPAALYNAVAQVLAWTFALKAGKRVVVPEGIPVPPGYDPLEGENP